MKNSGASVVEECLYLDLAHQQEGCIFPLHTSIALFLVAYCGSKTLKVFLVPSIKSDEGQESRVQLSKNMEVDIISREEIPLVAQNCRLPAIVEKDSMFCRAGLAAVLRHIVKKASAEDPSKKDVSELLGFKNTCLKACAEVSVRKKQKEKLADFPLILGWYRRVQEVPGVCRAAALCGMQFIHLYDSEYLKEEPQRPPITKQQETQDEEDSNFIGGPRPTMTKLMERGIKAIFSPHPSPSQTIDWGNLPAAVNPEEGKMSGHRALRKKQQIDNLVSAVTNLAKPGDVIVDFCSGGGHVGLVLAYLLPSCQVVLIENKEESLVRAKDRSEDLGLRNIWFIQGNLDYFTGAFNIGVALHACGVATDMVIGRCVRARAAFVVCPCCYGFIQNTVKSTFPRSHRFREVLSYREHMILCRFADQTDAQLPPERRLIGKRCMGLVDLDRAWAAEGCGYSAQVISMEPECCSPKNNMIVGAPL
ncbi:glutathione S-transferase C-terminal domain-containing protein isoform X3 [Ambystoma mexicanum]|uniref:glutathione S-transferase C-terminal domain-containing protein isoform X3 n=1 Tax=Ambystoma mexicanum TaxID=8296 RepID=UPI0037E6F7F8